MMIITERLLLVPLSQFSIPTKGEIEAFVSWLNSSDVMKFSENRHVEHSIESQKEYWASQLETDNRYWFIREKGKPKSALIGSIRAEVDNFNRTSNIGIFIGNTKNHRKGYGKEAFAAAIQAESVSGAAKVEAGMMAINTPMIKTALACGMNHEASIPGHFEYGGERIAKVLMGISF